MEDLILALLWSIAEFLLEAILEAMFEGLFTVLADLLLRAFRRVLSPYFPNAVLAAIGYGVLGFAVGGFSLIYFPHPLVHPSRIHGLSLLISPLVAGWMMELIGAALRKREKTVIQLESFGYGFAFAFGIALARFLWVR